MLDKIMQLNEYLIKYDFRDLLCNNAEEILKTLLNKEADKLVNAEKYEHSSVDHHRYVPVTIKGISLQQPEKWNIEISHASGSSFLKSPLLNDTTTKNLLLRRR